MPNTPEYGKSVLPGAGSVASRVGSGMRETQQRFVHASGVGSSVPEMSAEAEDAIYGDLDGPLFRPTVDCMRRDLLAAREDIKAGRVHSGESVIAEMRLAYAAEANRQRLLRGDSVG